MNTGWYIIVLSFLLINIALASALSANIVDTTNTSAIVSASSDTIVDFTIYYGTDSNNLDSSVLALDTTETFTVLDNLQPATLYSYYVTGCDDNGCIQTETSTFSTAAPVLTLEITGLTNESATLIVNADMLVDFTLFYDGGVQTGLPTELDVQSTSFMLSNLEANTTYAVSVQGCSAGNVCVFSAILGFTTLVNTVLEVPLENATSETTNETLGTSDVNITQMSDMNQTNQTETSETSTTGVEESAPVLTRGRRSVFVPLATKPAPTLVDEPSVVEPTSMSEESLAPALPEDSAVGANDPTGNALTGAATGTPTDASWMWLGIASGAGLVGLVVYRRR